MVPAVGHTLWERPWVLVRKTRKQQPRHAVAHNVSTKEVSHAPTIARVDSSLAYVHVLLRTNEGFTRNLLLMPTFTKALT